GETITAYDYANLRLEEYEDKKKDDDTGEVKIVTRQKWNLDTLWELDVDASGDLIKAGNRLYAGGKDKVTAVELQQNKNAAPKIAWEAEIEGTVGRIIAADDKLFVVTEDGKIYSFGNEPEETKTYAFQPEKKQLDPSIEQKARAILKTTGIQDGYCFVFGLTNGDLAEALVRNSDLRVIAFDPDPQKVDTLRHRFTKAGLYGPRLSVIEDDVDTLKVVPYLASLTVFADASKYKKDPSFLKTLYHHTRPYGGTILLDIPQEENSQTIKTVQTANLPKAKVYEREEGLLIAREGKLPGADDWTHQYGDIANTVKSDDERVKLPLGLLWYGGNSNMDVLPRHGHGPPEQVIGGRLFIEGMDCISARDVYTGRVLWKRTIPHLNNYMVYYDDTYKDTPLSTSYNQIHLPGANARGTNYIATKDTVYIIQEARCLLLDAKTGEDKGIIELPEIPTFGKPESWGYIGVYKDYLIAGMDFADYKKFFEIPDGLRSKSIPFLNYNITSSKHLVVMNRHNGEVKWAFKSDLGLLHNAIVVGNDKLFCMDKMPNPVADALQRRGKSYFGTPRIMAFDLNTGDIAWSKTQGVFGTWLGYAAKHDILLQSGRPSRDMIHGEVTEGMKAYRGTTGEPLWENKAQYGGPCILHNETIITDPHAYSLLTGKTLMREDPITQTKIPWSYKRMYGCNYSIASEHLMTFRSGAAGFYDLNTNGGTGNFGGFKSSCTSNLVVADGVLNAPDYTRTCSCSYQNQTSLAMFHDPSVEIWTFNEFDRKPGEPIRQLGLNFGAPGDRRAENGALWLEYPNNGSPSPEVSVTTTPDQPTWFLHHSSRYNEGNMNWVAASGVEGARTITIKVSDRERDPELYTVRLYFAEPKQKKAGERVFHVDLQGRRVLRNFDIVKEAGSIRTAVVREYNNIAISDKLTILLQPKNPDNEPILCGIELIATPAVQTTMKD
ncbi:PQQ-binding-like beta-propeller repeat protein, partial [bacterium]|nr:PQQ-binding-like beta-propeller repeat protein [bacterium]